MAQDWSGQNVTILGLSKSGIAVAQYLQKRGASCFLSETLPATPQNLAQRQALEALGVMVEMGGHSQQCFTHAPLVVVSPGIPPSSSVIQELQLSGKEIISEVELAFRETQVPMIGITGTNGKTTTTTLIAKLLQDAGLNAPACGNIGLPVISVLDEQTPDYLVVELSSFQLAFSPTLKAKVAVFMNLTPDHLDWHGSLGSYQQAKLRLFTGEQSPEWSVVLADDPVSSLIQQGTTGNVLGFSRSPSQLDAYANHITVDTDQTVVLTRDGQAPIRFFSLTDLKIKGRHNHENVLAAVATAVLLNISSAVIQSTCLNFEGVEHRLEPVLTLLGCTYYNDSKATNPEATLSALRAFESEKIVLIAGGRDKKGPLDDFVAEVKSRVDQVVLLGEAQERFADALRQEGYTHIHFVGSLEQAVERASELANKQPVLFSPACASFDMFKNYEERGAYFKALVTQKAAQTVEVG